tara:strand:+ start:38 stop:487 length:450 start_codon:yes stop_codon:yes gene_type:complete
MTVIPNEIIPYAFFFIILIFLLAIKKQRIKKEIIKIDKVLPSDDKEKRQLLENAENKLIALKDLYNQELIDASIYFKKTELVASNLSDKLGNDIMEIPEIQKKIIYSDLKKEIKRKIDRNQMDIPKTNIDNLITAVDNKIKSGNIYEEK